MEAKNLNMKPIDLCQYEGMVERLKREDNVLYHPRTKELIIGCTKEVHQTFTNSKGTATVTPAVAYHRFQNRTCGMKLRRILYCDIGVEVLQMTDEVELGKPTNQYKTVWYSKGQRRS